MMTWLNVTSWRHVFVYSVVITALSVAVPITVVSIALWHVPWTMQVPALLVAGAIPLFIAFPISVFALNLLRMMNSVMAKVDTLVRIDSLTGLLIRSYFFHLVTRHRKNNALFAIIDADHFKSINDNFGHDAGDEALVLLSQHLSQVFGTYGYAARLGGEEFGLYLQNVGLEQLRLLVAMLRSKLRTEPLVYDGRVIPITVSIGAVVDSGENSIKTLSMQADTCLYAAKHAGRDCCFVKNQVDEATPLAA
jgi:diguanylate cyclase